MKAGKIIDAHLHLYNSEEAGYRLHGKPIRPRRFGDYSKINTSYRPEQYQKDITNIDVAATIHVEAGYEGRSYEETERLAKLHESFGMPTAALVSLNLEEGGVPKQLKRHEEVSGDVQVIGARLHANWHADTRYRGASCRNLLKTRKLQECVKAISDAGYVTEINIYHTQADDLLRLVDDVPDSKIVLGHAGLPVHFDQPDVPFDNPRKNWVNAIKKLSSAPNVSVKLSGFWMCGRALNFSEYSETLDTVVNSFGVRRCIFGSNFPIDSLFTTYSEMTSYLGRYLRGAKGSAAVDAVFFENAQRIFNLCIHK